MQLTRNLANLDDEMIRQNPIFVVLYQGFSMQIIMTVQKQKETGEGRCTLVGEEEEKKREK